MARDGMLGEHMGGDIVMSTPNDVRELTPHTIRKYLRSRLYEIKKEIEIQDKFIDAMLMLVQTPDVASKVNKAEAEIERLRKEEKRVQQML
jgi:hypothetical protein